MRFLRGAPWVRFGLTAILCLAALWLRGTAETPTSNSRSAKSHTYSLFCIYLDQQRKFLISHKNNSPIATQYTPFKMPVATTHAARFNAKNSEFVHLVYLCVLHNSHNKQPLFSTTTVITWSFSWKHTILCQLQNVSLHMIQISAFTE